MILQGRNLIIKADGVAIAAAKSCDINVHCEEIETSSPQTGIWRTAIIGRKSWSVSTNQLVKGLVSSFAMVGTTVSLEVSINGDIDEGKAFDGFVDNEPIQQQSYSGTPNAIYWDKTRKKFLAMVQESPFALPKYYINWSDGGAYISPSSGDMFTYSSQNYVYLNGDLHTEKLRGSANVVDWRVTGTVGNLAQGSFQFSGNAELAPARLPLTSLSSFS